MVSCTIDCQKRNWRSSSSKCASGSIHQRTSRWEAFHQNSQRQRVACLLDCWKACRWTTRHLTNNVDDDWPIKQETHFKQESWVSVKQETCIKKELSIQASWVVHLLKPHMLVPKTPTSTCRISHKRTLIEVSSGSSSLLENPVQFWMQRQQKRREKKAQRQYHKTKSLESPLPRLPLPRLPLLGLPLILNI